MVTSRNKRSSHYESSKMLDIRKFWELWHPKLLFIGIKGWPTKKCDSLSSRDSASANLHINAFINPITTFHTYKTLRDITSRYDWKVQNLYRWWFNNLLVFCKGRTTSIHKENVNLSRAHPFKIGGKCTVWANNSSV